MTSLGLLLAIVLVACAACDHGSGLSVAKNDGGEVGPTVVGRDDGGGSEPNADSKSDGGDFLPLADLEASLTQAQCEYMVRCGGYPDAVACKTSMLWTVDQVIAGVTAGRMTYDGRAAAACRDVIRSTGCNTTDQPEDSPQACLTTFRGNLVGGAQCSRNEECISAKCDSISCSNVCCAGTCAPERPPVSNPVPVGGDCSQVDAICEAGSYCLRSSADEVCWAGIPVGGDCNPNEDNHCMKNVRCLPSASSQGGTCTAPPSEGEPCGLTRYQLACNSSNDYCDLGTGKCLRKAAVGMPCPAGAECVDYANCDPATLLCVARKRAGEACDESQGQPACMAVLECTDGTCVLPVLPPANASTCP